VIGVVVCPEHRPCGSKTDSSGLCNRCCKIILQTRQPASGSSGSPKTCRKMQHGRPARASLGKLPLSLSYLHPACSSRTPPPLFLGRPSSSFCSVQDVDDRPRFRRSSGHDERSTPAATASPPSVASARRGTSCAPASAISSRKPTGGAGGAPSRGRAGGRTSGAGLEARLAGGAGARWTLMAQGARGGVEARRQAD
jgi:hypothetical protein